MLCSKVGQTDGGITNGVDFCRKMGFRVSELKEATFRLDRDCFNGKTSVGVKYDALEI